MSTYKLLVMKKHLLLLALLIGSLTAFSQTVKTTTNVNLRQTANGSVITVVPKGSAVEILDTANGWAKVTYGNKIGYLKTSLLHTSGSQEVKTTDSPDNTAVKHYINSSGQRIQSPTYYNSPPSGATAECRDGTYSFSANHRGTCSHHGGVKRWL